MNKKWEKTLVVSHGLVNGKVLTLTGFPDYIDYNTVMGLGLVNRRRGDCIYSEYKSVHSPSEAYPIERTKRELVIYSTDGYRLTVHAIETPLRKRNILEVWVSTDVDETPKRLHRMHYEDDHQKVINDIITELASVLTKLPEADINSKYFKSFIGKLTKRIILRAWGGHTIDLSQLPSLLNGMATTKWAYLGNPYLSKFKCVCHGKDALHMGFSDNNGNTAFKLLATMRPAVIDSSLNNEVYFIIGANTKQGDGGGYLEQTFFTTHYQWDITTAPMTSSSRIDGLFRGGIIDALNEQLARNDKLFIDGTGDEFNAFTNELCKRYSLAKLDINY